MFCEFFHWNDFLGFPKLFFPPMSSVLFPTVAYNASCSYKEVINQFNLTTLKTSQQTGNLTKIPADSQPCLDIILVIWSLILQLLQAIGSSAWTWGLHGMSPCKVIKTKIDSIPEQDQNLCTNSFSDEDGKKNHPYYFTAEEDQRTLD